MSTSTKAWVRPLIVAAAGFVIGVCVYQLVQVDRVGHAVALSIAVVALTVVLVLGS